MTTAAQAARTPSLPPRGGSGLKYLVPHGYAAPHPSPSARREWIEIRSILRSSRFAPRLPPRGGSGLKCEALAVLLDGIGLPPRGGSGLKSSRGIIRAERGPSPSARREWIEIWAAAISSAIATSPSARREWIEMATVTFFHVFDRVSLREEGVD